MNKTAAIHAETPTLIAPVIFTLISLGLGVVANFAQRRGSFLEKYFLGNRSLGAFAVALTAAVMSGGTFMGFPSLVYTFGWVVALWIASYMVAPLTVLGVLGKRIGQISRRTGAITLPDLFRERFGSPALGLLTSLVVVFFLTCNLVSQFKAGAVIMKIVLPAGASGWLGGTSTLLRVDPTYLAGLVIFTATVVAYTTYGGFLAAIWTDVFQSIVMAIGVVLLFPLAMEASGGLGAATYSGMAQTDPGFGFGPAPAAFHPITLAISFFFMWAVTGMGQPSTLVRLMAFRDARTLRYSIIYLTIYNLIIYVPLVFIFVAARTILPSLASSDDVMPSLVIKLANPYVAGLILAAPYGAVLSTVSGWLLIVSSGLVHDIYQRFLRPTAGDREIAWASYSATGAIGLVAAAIATHPPTYLQLIIVFSATGMASAFLMPALLGAFWRRTTAAGAIAAMASGVTVTLGLYLLGTLGPDRLGVAWLFGPNPPIGAPGSFRPYYLLGFDPCIWGLSSSLTAGLLVSLVSRPPDEKRVSLLFDAQAAE